MMPIIYLHYLRPIMLVKIHILMHTFDLDVCHSCAISLTWLVCREADWSWWHLHQEAEGGMSMQHCFEGANRSVSLKCLEISFMFCSQETDGLKPKKGAKGKRGRNSRQQASAPQGEIKVCSIEGTRASIDKCLDIVKQK